MNKKGVSPLMAWILIIAFALALGAFIMNWATNQVGKFDPSQNAELYCPDVDFSITNFCVKSDYSNVNFDLKNTGRYTIRKLTIARDTFNTELGSCYYLGTPVDPGTEEQFILNLGGVLVGDNKVEDCDHLEIGTEENDLPEIIEILPWIDVDNQSIACTDRKKKINSEFFEKTCSS